MKGTKAKPLVEQILAELSPALPHGVRIEVTAGKHTLGLQQVHPGDIRVAGILMRRPHPERAEGTLSYKTWVPRFGTWIPFLPPTVHARIVAQDIVETLLEVAYTDDGIPDARRFEVHTRIEDRCVIVSYQPRGAPHGTRIDLQPIPMSRLR